MPNWNENHFVIVGDETKMKPIIDKVDEIKKDGLLDTLYPTPKELLDTSYPSKKSNQELIEKYGFDNWYEWRSYHYGSKWGDGRQGDEIPVEIEKVKGEKGDELRLSIWSDTPWCSPSEGLRYLATRYKGLLFMNLSIEEQMIWGVFEFYLSPFMTRNNYFVYDKIQEDIKEKYNITDDDDNLDPWMEHVYDHSNDILYEGLKKTDPMVETLLTKHYKRVINV